MLGCGLSMLMFLGTTIIIQNSLNNLLCSLFAFMFFGLMPFILVWTVIGTIWYLRIPDHSCVKTRQIPEDISKNGVLQIMFLYSYVVSALTGILFCTGLYYCYRIRSHGLLLLRELRQDNFELSSVYRPLDNKHLEQLEACTVGSEET
jgi:hypothetical protein